MRRLNREEWYLKGKMRTRPHKPEQLTFKVRGKELVVDALLLLAAETDGIEYPAPSTEEMVQPPPGASFVRTMIFNVTHACDLQCSYCFVRNFNEDHVFQDMPLDVAKQALKLIRYNPKASHNPDMNIGFFGGEPLMAFDRVKEIVAAVEAEGAHRGTKVQFHMTTNGTLVTEEVADFLAEHRFGFIVSLDGPEAVHNEYRPLKGGGNSHAATLEGLRRLAGRRNGKDGVRGITLRGTFTGEGVDLVDRLEYLNQLCDDGLAQGVSVEPVSLTEDGCMALPDGHEQAITMHNVRQFRVQYERAADWFLDRIRRGKRARFHHFYKMMERVYDRKTACTECGAGMGYITVDPYGALYACHREGGGAGKVGDVWGGVDERMRARWTDNRWYAREKCPDCRYRWLCGGGCRMNSLDRFGNLTTPDPVSCWFKKVWIRWVVWLLSEMTEAEVMLAMNRKTHPDAKGCTCGS